MDAKYFSGGGTYDQSIREKINNQKTDQINGPINVARLEGIVNGVHKTLYLFMDLHVPVEYQTRCNDLMADDIYKYIIKIVQNNKKTTYDFLLEILPTVILNSQSPTRSKYIWETQKLFTKEFNYDKKNDKVLPTKSFLNLRLHYIDIRDIIELQTYANGMDLKAKINSSRGFMTTNNLKYMFENVIFIRQDVDYIYSLFNEQQISKEQKGGKQMLEFPKTNEKTLERIKEILSKIKHKYKNSNVHDILIPLYNQMVKNQYDKVISIFKELIVMFNEGEDLIKLPETKVKVNDDISYQVKGMNKYVKRISKLINDYVDGVVDFFVLFVDVYFLRRFLDKEYIEHGIAYTGIHHSCYYLYVLVKYFDFKITHINHSDIKDMEELNSYIKDCQDMNVDFLYNFYPQQLNQCVDLKDFPKNLI